MRTITKTMVIKMSRYLGHRNTNFLQFLFVKIKFNGNLMSAVLVGTDALFQLRGCI